MLKLNFLYTFFNLLFCKQAMSYILSGKSLLFFEKRKMLSNEYYNSGKDVILFFEKQFCKKLCFDYNNIPPDNMRKRGSLICKIIGKVGKSFLIEQPFMCDYGYNIEIGENFCSSHNLLILDPAKVKFGDNVFVGPNCSFYTSCHPIESDLRNMGLSSARPIEVGNNVWFGGNVVVLGGVKIGDNAVIGAGSIVKEDIPANSVAVGNPCKVVKETV